MDSIHIFLKITIHHSHSHFRAIIFLRDFRARVWINDKLALHLYTYYKISKEY